MSSDSKYAMVNTGKIVDLDELLTDYGLGPYQVSVCALMALVLMYSNISPLSYAISTDTLKYRCEIPECETNPIQYEVFWNESAIPLDNDADLEKCKMYQYIKPDSNNTNTCEPTSFNRSVVQECDRSRLVFYDTDSIAKDFNLTCKDNVGKLSFVGTINSVGQFVGIALSGFMSDKYGRKYIMILGSVLSAILGTMRSFSPGYVSFVILEFVDSVVSSGMYGITLILGLELVSPKARVSVSMLMGCFYPMGAVFLGLVAYFANDWRMTLRIVYLPGLLILGYIWYIPESIRWLQTQNRMDEVIKVLSKVAKSNKKKLPTNIKEILAADSSINNNSVDEKKLSWRKLARTILNSKTIYLRLINCSFCWMTLTLVYYGLSLGASTAGFDGFHKHLTFAIVNLIEVPAFLTSWFLMDHYSRRYTQANCFLSSGVCLLAFLILRKTPKKEYIWLKVLTYVSGKFCITMAFNTMYVFTAEMFPTDLRMSLLGISSMFGRLGSTLAPQMKLVETDFGKDWPIIVFLISSFIAGFLSFLFPETKDEKLPDTVTQAEIVGEIENVNCKMVERS